jgi:heavy metal sensor kinase
MSSKTRPRVLGTLAFRLTIYYTLVFTLSTLGAFVAFDALVSSDLQTRADQELLNELHEYSSLLSIKGLETLKTVMSLEAESEGIEGVFFRILTQEGQVLASTNLSLWEDVGVDGDALKQLSAGAEHVFQNLARTGSKGNARLLYGTLEPGKILQLGKSMEEETGFILASRGIFGRLLLLMLLGSGLIGWFMARRALSGVEEITRTAREISGGALERRVPLITGGAELDQLADTFNSMLDRIQALVMRMREVTDDIAHDLRSPITRIRGIAEMTLVTAKTVDEYQGLAAVTIEECDRLLKIINTMLDISEAEAGAAKLKMGKLDMAQVVLDACTLFQPVAEDKGVKLISEVRAACFVEGDLKRLQRMAANLLDNALKYTPAGGTVVVSLHCDAEQADLSIQDTGMGISRDDLPHIFERFYRCEESRSAPGAGLGLSLALAIARAHGGDITVKSTPGEGSVFAVRLPRSRLPSQQGQVSPQE